MNKRCRAPRFGQVSGVAPIATPVAIIGAMHREETAQAAVEYILIAAVMALFAILQIKALCAAFGSKFIKTALMRMHPAP